MYTHSFMYTHNLCIHRHIYVYMTMYAYIIFFYISKRNDSKGQEEKEFFVIVRYSHHP